MAAKKPKATDSTFPSVLAFSRKLEVSDALMASGLWSNRDNLEHWEPIKLYEKRNRATHSQYGAEDKKKSEPNLSWGDDAALPHTADTLRVSFTMKVMGQLEEPTACNEPMFEENLKAAIRAYRETHQFKELAVRYAYNIANARFLWRNRVGAESIRVQIKHGMDTWIFDAYQYQLQGFSHPTQDNNFTSLAAVIQRGLQGNSFEYLEITTFAKIGLGQRIWPSQEMVLNPPKENKTKFLFQLNGCAAMHSEKIGNALRTIDTWYTDESNCMAIAVEPYGSATTRGKAYRKSNNDFYTLLNKWLYADKVPENQQHYMIAILIRGGVFGGKE